jgi:hypothetical protein
VNAPLALSQILDGRFLGTGQAFGLLLLWDVVARVVEFARRLWLRGISELLDERTVCFDAQYHAMDAGLCPQTM